MLCKCGCGQEIVIKSHHKYYGIPLYIRGHHRRGVKLLDRTKRKMSKKKKQYYKDHPEMIMKKGTHPFYGKHRSLETKQKISDNHPDQKGENNHMYGKIHSSETKQKISDNHPDQKGELNPNWQGGTSFAPYCPKFTNEFKERVREYFDRKCYLCNKNEIENGKRLCVHHVNYDKMVCCNDVKPLFVPLCKQCHPKTNGDREFWEEFFTISLEFLTDGECYK